MIWLLLPSGDPRLLNDVIGIGFVAGERDRESLQPRGVGQELGGGRRFAHTYILSPTTETLPKTVAFCRRR
jgi:hypothetical protein